MVESSKDKKEERPPAHKVAIELLKEFPTFPVISVLSSLYERAKVPAEDIPKLIQALESAGSQLIETPVPRSFSPAIESLVQQLKEQETN